MGTRGTHSTDYLSHKINELPRTRRRLDVSRETFSQVSFCTTSSTRRGRGSRNFFRTRRCGRSKTFAGWFPRGTTRAGRERGREKNSLPRKAGGVKLNTNYTPPPTVHRGAAPKLSK